MIYELLYSGEESSISNANLSRRLGISERQVRREVYKERRAGYPILSGVNGYYLPSENPEIAKHQWLAFQKEQRKHSISHAETAGIAGKALKQLAQIGGTE